MWVEDLEALLLEDRGDSRSKAAGVLVVCRRTKRMLLQKRSATSDNPNTWSLFAGTVKTSETFEEGARREFREETGYTRKLDLKELMTHESGSARKFTFQNYMAVVAEEFFVKADGETGAWGWFQMADLKDLKLHPGFAKMMRDRESLKEIRKYVPK